MIIIKYFVFGIIGLSGVFSIFFGIPFIMSKIFKQDYSGMYFLWLIIIAVMIGVFATGILFSRQFGI